MLTIREAVHDDLGELLELYTHFPRQDEPARPADIAVAWAEILAAPGVYTYVGEIRPRLVTSCTLIVVPSLRRGPSPYAFIENVVTHTEFRRKGYGTAVMQHALTAAWRLSCSKVMLLTGSKEEGTLSFYENVGLDRGIKTGFVAGAPPLHNSSLHPTTRSARAGERQCR